MGEGEELSLAEREVGDDLFVHAAQPRLRVHRHDLAVFRAADLIRISELLDQLFGYFFVLRDENGDGETVQVQFQVAHLLDFLLQLLDELWRVLFLQKEYPLLVVRSDDGLGEVGKLVDRLRVFEGNQALDLFKLVGFPEFKKTLEVFDAVEGVDLLHVLQT